jgi:hypothetical protein
LLPLFHLIIRFNDLDSDINLITAENKASTTVFTAFLKSTTITWNPL